VLIFSLASVVAELLTIVWFFTKKELQNISGSHIATCDLYYKSFAIVIYDHNDNSLYYKTTIVANLTTIIGNLALARSVNYNHKVHWKLKRTLMIINYNPKPFIVLATGGRNWQVIYPH
jgi:hypothetical protein